MFCAHSKHFPKSYFLKYESYEMLAIIIKRGGDSIVKQLLWYFGRYSCSQSPVVLLFSVTRSPLPYKRIVHSCQSLCDAQWLRWEKQASLAPCDMPVTCFACDMLWPMDCEHPSRSSKMPWKFLPVLLLLYPPWELRMACLGQGCSFSLRPRIRRCVGQSHDDMKLVTCDISKRYILGVL